MARKPAMAAGALIVAMLALPQSAGAESFIWRFQNATPHPIVVQLYSRARSQTWPEGGKVWSVPPDGVVYSNDISCQRGEYICFGGWSAQRPDSYWGAGQGGLKGCKTCCYHCNGAVSRIIRFNP